MNFECIHLAWQKQQWCNDMRRTGALLPCCLHISCSVFCGSTMGFADCFHPPWDRSVQLPHESPRHLSPSRLDPMPQSVFGGKCLSHQLPRQVSPCILNNVEIRAASGPAWQQTNTTPSQPGHSRPGHMRLGIVLLEDKASDEGQCGGQHCFDMQCCPMFQ